MALTHDQLYHYSARIVKVIDADTIDIDVDLGFHLTRRERVRVANIDAWELRGSEREAGLKAKKYVELALPVGFPVLVKTQKWSGKYGRYIAEIWFESLELGALVDLGAQLIKEGHAEPYKG